MSHNHWFTVEKGNDEMSLTKQSLNILDNRFMTKEACTNRKTGFVQKELCETIMKGITAELMETKQALKDVNIKLDNHADKLSVMSLDIMEIKILLIDKTEKKTSKIDKDVVMNMLKVIGILGIIIILILSGDTTKAIDAASKIMSGG